MSGPIDVSLYLNVDDVAKGAEKVADAVGEIDDSLNDTAKAGEKAFDGLSDSAKDAADKIDGDLSKSLKGVEKDVDKAADSFKDVDKAADKAFDGVEDSAKDASKVIDRDLTKALDDVIDKAKTTGKTIGREVKDGTDKAGEGFKDMKEEAASTAKESAASFGSIEDSADALQEILANAFVGMGPAGMAAGILAAAGLGLVISAATDSAEKTNEAKEKMLGLAQAMKDNGGSLSMADYIKSMEDYGYAIQDSKEWFEVWQADAVSGFEELRRVSDDTGLSMSDLFKGAFGDSDDAKAVLKVVEQKLIDIKEKKEALMNTEGVILNEIDTRTLTSYEKAKELIDENIKTQEAAELVEKARRESIEGTTEATLEDVAALEKRNSIIQDGVTSELDYLDQVAQTNKILEENGTTLDKNTEAGRNNQRALIDQSDAALDMAQSQLEAGVSADVVAQNLAAQREALLLVLDATTGNRDESLKLAEAYGLIPSEVITEIKTNGGAESKAEIEGIPATKDTDVTVDDGGTAGQTQGRVNSIQGKDVKVDVQDFRTAEQTQGRIDSIKGKDVKIDVQDFNTVSQTQTRINGLAGKDVAISVSISNYDAVNNDLARLTAPRTAYVDVVQRSGEKAP